jgi:hypothetical protein
VIEVHVANLETPHPESRYRWVREIVKRAILRAGAWSADHGLELNRDLQEVGWIPNPMDQNRLVFVTLPLWKSQLKVS